MDKKEYNYKGNKYMVLGDLKVKHPDTGEWFDAVRYEDRTGQNYGRETKDFYNKFKTRDDDETPTYDIILKLSYKGYTGEAKYLDEYEVYHGKLSNVGEDLVDFSGSTRERVVDSFKDSVDDYIIMLEELKLTDQSDV